MGIILTDDVINLIRRNIRKMSPSMKVDADAVRGVLENEVIKREIFDDERCADAKKRITKAARAEGRKKAAAEKE